MGCKSSEKPMRKHKRGLWSPEEDQRLRDYILQHGISCWSSVPANAGLQRNGKSCRLRWINYLRPGLKRGVFSSQEEEMIMTLHKNLGNKWSQIAKELPGRTDNEIKNYWHSYLKKRVAKSGEVEVTKEPNFANMSMEENESTKNNTKKVMGFEIIENISNEGPISSIEQDLQEISRQEHQNLIPKLVFADWLTNDHNSIEQNGHGFDIMSHKHEDYLHGYSYNNNEGSTSCMDDAFCQQIGDGNLQKGMMDLPFIFQDQSTLGNNFIGLSAENAVYSGF